MQAQLPNTRPTSVTSSVCMAKPKLFAVVGIVLALLGSGLAFGAKPADAVIPSTRSTELALDCQPATDDPGAVTLSDGSQVTSATALGNHATGSLKGSVSWQALGDISIESQRSITIDLPSAPEILKRGWEASLGGTEAPISVSIDLKITGAASGSGFHQRVAYPNGLTVDPPPITLSGTVTPVDFGPYYLGVKIRATLDAGGKKTSSATTSATVNAVTFVCSGGKIEFLASPSGVPRPNNDTLSVDLNSLEPIELPGGFAIDRSVNVLANDVSPDQTPIDPSTLSVLDSSLISTRITDGTIELVAISFAGLYDERCNLDTRIGSRGATGNDPILARSCLVPITYRVCNTNGCGRAILEVEVRMALRSRSGTFEANAATPIWVNPTYTG